VIGKLLNFCLRTVFPKAAVLLRNIKILAAEQGQWRSIAQRSAVDRQGQPLPWYTYPAIEYLNTFDLSNCNVFEFGAGNSSLYWARRARTVTSVEDDAQWHEQVQARALPNQDLLHRRDRDGYVAAIENGAAPHRVHQRRNPPVESRRDDHPRQLRPRDRKVLQRATARGRIHPSRFLRIRSHQRLRMVHVSLLPTHVFNAPQSR
jgi:hypothetical protein